MRLREPLNTIPWVRSLFSETFAPSTGNLLLAALDRPSCHFCRGRHRKRCRSQRRVSEQLDKRTQQKDEN